MFSYELNILKIEKAFNDAMKKISDKDIGVAVSGGGDSLALLVLSHGWAKRNGRQLMIASVDHGLRSESSSECKKVKRIANSFGLKHSTLVCPSLQKGNLQNSARKARLELLKIWAKKNNLSLVLLGHNLDDNAETILLRLIRGSGIDGLTGISASKLIYGLRIFRPLLSVSRDDLRRFLCVKGLNWIEDPSNFDKKFDRIKVRNFVSSSSNVGLTSEKLVEMAKHMERAKVALNDSVLRFAFSSIKLRSWGDIEVNYKNFCNCSEEVQFRVISTILRWNSGKFYNPRFDSLQSLNSAIIGDVKNLKRSLMGSIISYKEGKITFKREVSAIQKRKLIQKQKFIWDHKWEIEVRPEKVFNSSIGPVGEVAQKISNFSCDDIPKSSLAAMPALFENEDLICVPSIKFGTGFKFKLIDGESAFVKFLASC